MLWETELCAYTAARSREPKKERQEKEQVHIWPLFPSSFPLRKHILLLANMFVAYEREDFGERPAGSRQKNTQQWRLRGGSAGHFLTQTRWHTHTFRLNFGERERAVCSCKRTSWTVQICSKTPTATFQLWPRGFGEKQRERQRHREAKKKKKEVGCEVSGCRQAVRKSAERKCLETTCVFASVLIQGRCEVAEEKDNEERKQKSLQRDSRCRS